MVEDFEEHGRSAIETVREQKPLKSFTLQISPNIEYEMDFWTKGGGESLRITCTIQYTRKGDKFNLSF